MGHLGPDILYNIYNDAHLLIMPSSKQLQRARKKPDVYAYRHTCHTFFRKDALWQDQAISSTTRAEKFHYHHGQLTMIEEEPAFHSMCAYAGSKEDASPSICTKCTTSERWFEGQMLPTASG